MNWSKVNHYLVDATFWICLAAAYFEQTMAAYVAIAFAWYCIVALILILIAYRHAFGNLKPSPNVYEASMSVVRAVQKSRKGKISWYTVITVIIESLVMTYMGWWTGPIYLATSLLAERAIWKHRNEGVLNV